MTVMTNGVTNMTAGRRLVEGVDYFLRFVRFPNRGNTGAVIPNDDGTYDIYVNTQYYPDEAWVRSVVSHFEVLGKGIEEIENEAG